jgi:RNA polymerase sigma-70 factor (ECF subfamily)
MQDTDEKLMLQVAQGDIAAFEQLVNKYKKSVINVIYRFIGRQGDAEDLAQEAFLRVYEARNRYRPIAKFSTYLFRIVSNLCINYKRRPEPLSLDEIALNPTSNSSNPETLVERDERNAMIRTAIDSLPKNQRMAIILQRFEHASYKEIADKMGTSISAVEALIYRAKQTLKKKLEPLHAH